MMLIVLVTFEGQCRIRVRPCPACLLSTAQPLLPCRCPSLLLSSDPLSRPVPGAALGMVETQYCRLQSTWLSGDNVDDAEAEDTLRRLVMGTGGDTDKGFSPPVSYVDTDNCPPRSSGPLGMFDLIDFYCCLANLFVWLLIQVWAVYRYSLVRSLHALGRSSCHMPFAYGAIPN